MDTRVTWKPSYIKTRISSMKKIILTVLFLAASTTSFAHEAKPADSKQVTTDSKSTAHSGGTNSEGCHNDHKHGTYHCH
jgi:hypothetical protein